MVRTIQDSREIFSCSLSVAYRHQEKVIFALYANRINPFTDPNLRPIDPPPFDDPSAPYLDKSDIPEDCFERALPVNSNTNTSVFSQNSAALHPALQLNVQSHSRPEQVVIDNETVFNAEKILKSPRKKEREYRVKWYGYPKTQVDLGTRRKHSR